MTQSVDRDRWTLLADLRDVRAQSFAKSLRERGIEPNLIDYRDLLRGKLEDLADVGERSVLRLESPGDAVDLWSEITNQGREASNGHREPAVSPPEYERGRLAFTPAWYRGWCALLERVRRTLSDRRLLYCAHPDDIVFSFDKLRSQQALAAAGVDVPRLLGSIASYSELREKMHEARLARVFVKLRHGSAGSGVLAYETNGSREQIWTTIESRDEEGELKLFNSLKQRRVTDLRAIEAIVDAQAAYGSFAEEWVPKASCADKRFDLRVLIVGGARAHTVARLSRSPLTNLHLFGERRDLSDLRTDDATNPLDREILDQIDATCGRVTKVYGKSLHLALDIAVRHTRRSVAVLEVNSFGDLIHGVTHRGLTPYEAQIDAVTTFDAESLDRYVS
ncbi:MAG: STM4014 family protein [Planctomycetota bacterium]